MTIFAVLAHHDPDTFRLLARALHPYPVIAHVDARTPADPFHGEDNVTFVRERVAVNWGGFSAVTATRRLYEQAIGCAKSDDEYVVLLSGQCLPIRPIIELEQLLQNAGGTQFCKAGLLLDGHTKNENRVRRRWLFDALPARGRKATRRLNALLRRIVCAISHPRSDREFRGISVVAGSQWTALTVGCLRSILANEELLSRTERVTRHALAPDEIFFHTLVHSTEWGKKTLTPSPVGKGHRATADFANLHFIDVSLTRYLSSEDLPGVIKTGAYFARKFAQSHDAKLPQTISDAVRSTRIQGGR